MKSIRIPILLLAACFLAAPGGAQDTGAADADDPFAVDFFGDQAAEGETEGGEALLEEAPEASGKKAGLEFLKTESVKWGGSFEGKAGPSWTSRDPWGQAALDDYGLDLTLKGSLYFDARPDEDFRVFGKLKTAWPFDGETATMDGTVPNTQIFELFADFSWNDAVYLRFGKQTVKWGVGYFFSPADVINLGEIDIQDPTAQREGPVALRVHCPVPGTQTNFWAYAILPKDAEDMKPEDVALAAKAEFLASSWEIGVGGWYRYDKAPKAVLTASGSVRKVSVFGEAVAAWGSDKTFVTDVDALTPGYVTTTKYDDKLFFSGTLGGYYYDADRELIIAAQYFYNGDGYEDGDREALIQDARDNYDAIEGVVGSDAASALVKGLIYRAGRHYAAASVSKSELFTDNFGASLTAVADLSDLSGYVIPTLTWEFFDYAKLSAFASFAFGGKNSEYVVLNDGAACTLGFYLTLGTGIF